MKSYYVKLRKADMGSSHGGKYMYGKDMNMDKGMKMEKGMYGKKMKLGQDLYKNKDMGMKRNYFSDSGRNWFKNPPSSFKVMGNLRGKGFNLRK